MGEHKELENKPELFIGIVRATGTDSRKSIEILEYDLDRVGYVLRPLHVSDELGNHYSVAAEPPPTNLINKMDAGDHVREIAGNDAVACMAIEMIGKFRKEADGKTLAYLIDSLKHPAEIRRLRQLYGRSFYVLGLYSSQKKRRESLVTRLKVKNEDPVLDEIMNRDKDGGIKHGQNVQQTFPLCDLFVDVDDHKKSQELISRFVELIFGNTFHTPTREEYCMFHAQAAALRSADLGRQVGAVIATKDADIVALGTNEVPKYGGGQFWPDEKIPDHRDWKSGEDWNDKKKKELLNDLLDRMRRLGKLNGSAEDDSTFVNQVFSEEIPKEMKGAKLLDIIGFFRSVHGETSAIIDAAKRGVAVAGHHMFVTAFPCHECARHIVAAGIEKVFYIEPYPKSLAADQYPDVICVPGESGTLLNHVEFEPFVGVAPRLYGNLFTGLERKDKSGKVITWEDSKAQLRYFEQPGSYRAEEERAISNFNQKLQEKEKANVAK